MIAAVVSSPQPSLPASRRSQPGSSLCAPHEQRDMDLLSSATSTAGNVVSYLAGSSANGATTEEPHQDSANAAADPDPAEHEQQLEAPQTVAQSDQPQPQTALLHKNVGALITALSLVSRLSLRFTAVFVETLLESARFSSAQSLSLTRRVLISAISSARAANSRLAVSGGDMNADAEAHYRSILDRYTNVGAYWIHTTFTLAELFTMSGFSLASTALSAASGLADESVRLFDSIFGSTDTSRALASIIWLVRKEVLTHPTRSGPTGMVAQLSNLTKALVAFALLQNYTWRHTVREQKLVALFDAVVVTTRRPQPLNMPSMSEEEPGHQLNALQTPNHLSFTSALEPRHCQSHGAELVTEEQGEETPRRLEDYFDGSEEESVASPSSPRSLEDHSKLLEATNQLEQDGKRHEVEVTTTEETTAVLRVLDECVSATNAEADQERHSVSAAEDWVLTRRPSSLELEQEQMMVSVPEPSHQRFKTVLSTMSRKVSRRNTFRWSPFQSPASSGTSTPVPSPGSQPSTSQALVERPAKRKRVSPAEALKHAFSKTRLSKEKRRAKSRSPPLNRQAAHHSIADQDVLPEGRLGSSADSAEGRAPQSDAAREEAAPSSPPASWMHHEPRQTNYPVRHIVTNLQSYSRFSSASYGQTFLRVFGIGRHTFDFPSTPSAHGNHHAFCAHTGIPLPSLLLSSFAEPTSFDNTRAQNMVYYLAVDHSTKSIVLTCRGSLGLSDLITDLTADYDQVTLPFAPAQGQYLAHKGMLLAAQKLLRPDSRIHDTLAQALQDYPDFGVVLTGHSLGGGVAALLAVILSMPRSAYEQHIEAHPPRQGDATKATLGLHEGSSAFVTSPSSGLPAGRPIAAYAYGPPCVASLDLAHYARGLVTSVVHGNDVVPSLSLGVVRDFVQLSQLLEDDPSLTSELIGRLCGLHRTPLKRQPGAHRGDNNPVTTVEEREPKPVAGVSPEIELSSEEFEHGRSRDLTTGAAYTDPRLTVPPPSSHQSGEDRELEAWLHATMKTIRANSGSLKLYPPGDVFLVDVKSLFVTCSGAQSPPIKQEGQRVTLHHVQDRATRFNEPVFARTMLLDHSPSNYEKAIDALALAALG